MHENPMWRNCIFDIHHVPSKQMYQNLPGQNNTRENEKCLSAQPLGLHSHKAFVIYSKVYRLPKIKGQHALHNENYLCLKQKTIPFTLISFCYKSHPFLQQ